MNDRLFRLPNLAPAEVDVLPFGAIRIARDGTIRTTFDYFFSFAHDAVNVTITFVKLPNDEIMIAAERLEPAATP
jgi:hypothetical protein